MRKTILLSVLAFLVVWLLILPPALAFVDDTLTKVRLLLVGKQ